MERTIKLGKFPEKYESFRRSAVAYATRTDCLAEDLQLIDSCEPQSNDISKVQTFLLPQIGYDLNPSHMDLETSIYASCGSEMLEHLGFVEFDRGCFVVTSQLTDRVYERLSKKELRMGIEKHMYILGEAIDKIDDRCRIELDMGKFKYDGTYDRLLMDHLKKAGYD